MLGVSASYFWHSIVPTLATGMAVVTTRMPTMSASSMMRLRMHQLSAGITSSLTRQVAHRRGVPASSRRGRLASWEPMTSSAAGVVIEPSSSRAAPSTGTLCTRRSARAMAAAQLRMVGVQKVRQVTRSISPPWASLAMNHAPTVKQAKLNGRLKMAA